MNKKNNKKVWIAITIFFLILSSCIGVAIAKISSRPSIDRIDDSNYYDSGEDKFDGSTITVDGITYERNTDIKNVLLLGIDKSAEEIESADIAFEAGGRADVIAILAINKKTETVDVIGISRDTMVNVDVYGKDNIFVRTANMQIALQYSVADNMKRGNWLMKNKVSEILYGLPISGTVSFTMDGISTLIEAIGGITVTMDDNYKIFDKIYTKGKTVKLNGKEAYDFIHYRDINEFGSNNIRMKRHILIMRTLASKLKDIGDSGIEMLQKVAEPYMESDIDADTIHDIAKYQLSDSVITLPGENREGTHDEFYLDDIALRDIIIKTFYVPAQ